MTGTAQAREEPPPAILLDERTIGAHVERIAGQLTRDHPDGVVLIGVLKGALIFLADLVRAITDIDVTVDFLAISRYALSSGTTRGELSQMSVRYEPGSTSTMRIPKGSTS